MEKLKIKLNKAIKLKTTLEKSIDEDNELIQTNNSIIEGNTRKIDIEEVESFKELKSEFLIELNLIIQETNLKKGKGEKVSNAYNVKKLSEMQRELKHLDRIEDNIKDGVVIADNQKIKYNSKITFKDIVVRKKGLQKDVETYKNKLSKFNESTDISISYDTKLKEIIESTGIEL